MFLQVCVCPQGGRVSASVHAGMPYPPPGPGIPPPGTRQKPPPGQGRTPPQTRQTPSGPGRHPPPPGTRQTPCRNKAEPPLDQAYPPGTRQTKPPPPPPPGKQAPAYGLRAAGTHPTGMHSCLINVFSQSTPESWAQFTHDNITRAEHERMASIQLRTLIDNVLVDTSRDMGEQNNVVNQAFARRVAEVQNAKDKLQDNLKKVREIRSGKSNLSFTPKIADVTWTY